MRALVASIVFFSAAAFCGEPTLADLLPGTWRGTHTAVRSAYQHVITIQKQGAGKFTGQSLTWFALTEDQARAAAKGQRPTPAFPKAMCFQQQFAITLDNDTVTFKCTGTNSLFNAAGYALDTYTGKLTAPGVIAGDMSSAQKDSGGPFEFAKEELLKKPQALEVPRSVVTKLDCLHTAKSHYTCYLPANYDHEKPTPVLINFSPSGNAQPFSTKMADELGWIMVGLTESKNGPMQPICENRDAVLFDLQRRFHIDMKHIYFSGFSGGARSSSEASLQYPGINAGLILIGAAYGSMPPPKEVPIFYITGTTDMNRKEVEAAHTASKSAGRACDLIIHPGGHEWGPVADHETALRWLAKQTAPKKP